MSPAPTPRTRRGRTGITAESVARRHLEAAGWRILAANLIVGRGELDLVALDPDDPGALVVVEVRGTRTGRFGPPEGSIDHRKLGRVMSGAWTLLRGEWLAEQRLEVDRVRVDVVAVELGPTIGPGAGGPVVRHIRGVG